VPVPDTPEKTKAWWLSAEEKKQVVLRLPPKQPRQKISLKAFWVLFRKWQWIGFTLLFTCQLSC
jgi:hypothetical protein